MGRLVHIVPADQQRQASLFPEPFELPVPQRTTAHTTTVSLTPEEAA